MISTLNVTKPIFIFYINVKKANGVKGLYIVHKMIEGSYFNCKTKKTAT